MRIIDADQVRSLGFVAATQAIVDALRAGVDPAAGPPRIGVDLPAGQMLLMPAHDSAAAGVKVVTVAPQNPARGLPRIQATYLLFDGTTLALQALIDGTALTTLRTPALSMAGALPCIGHLPLDVVVIGCGPQALGHAEALAAHRELASLTYLVRETARSHLPAEASQAILGSSAATNALREAEVVVCATSAREPLFDSALLRQDAVVITVGSHEPDARELDANLMGRAFVIVEDVHTALREAGDVAMAVAAGALDPSSLVSLARLVRGEVPVPADRPVVIKTVGMAWEDLAVARAAYSAASAAR